MMTSSMIPHAVKFFKNLIYLKLIFTSSGTSSVLLFTRGGAGICMPGKRQNFLATWISLSLIYKNPVQKKNATSQQRVHENKKKRRTVMRTRIKASPF